MNNTWRVFTRDIKRILAVPTSLIIVIGVLVTPALYSWLNIAAFWNPYEATGELPIAVVNEDEGTESDLTGEINVGDEIVAQLKGNDLLGWRFLDKDEAADAVASGEVYASFIIPASFSADLVGIFTGEHHQPTIDYYVNEKHSAIAPKITDAGASGLDIEITSAFREQVSKAVVQALREGGVDLDTRITGAKGSAQAALAGIREDLVDAQGSLDDAVSSVKDSSATVEELRSALAAADPALADVGEAIGDAETILSTVVADAQSYAIAANGASITAQNALAESMAAANQAVASLSSSLAEANTQLGASTGRADEALARIRDALAVLEGIPGAEDAAKDLADRLDRAQELVDAVEAAGADTSEARTRIDALAKSFTDAAGAAQSIAGDTREAAADAVTTLSSRVTELSASIGGLSSTVTSARATLSEISSLVDGLDAQLGSTVDVLTRARSTLGDFARDTDVVRADTATIAAALQSGTLETIIGLDADNIGAYLASPVKFDQQAFYPVYSYGSGMAAMFINLSLWIGSFILIIIFRVEVDKEGFTWLALRSAYMGRFLLLAVHAMGQGIIVSAGSLLMGVQAVNPFAFIATATVIGLCYLSIIYALVTAFSHIGRALAIVLVVLQIPGASGIYPIELMPGFFRSLYPLLPFSYGIDAMRETIGGFYDGHYAHLMGALLLMGATALILGFIGRRYLGYFTRLFYEDLGRTELVAKEDVELIGANFRLSHIIALLSNRKEFSRGLARRREAFRSRYVVIIRGLTIVGLLGLVALGIVSRTTSAAKPVLLAIAVIWGLVIMGALIATEGVKRSLVHAGELSALSEDELFARLAQHRSLFAPSIPEEPAHRGSRRRRGTADAEDAPGDAPELESDSSLEAPGTSSDSTPAEGKEA